MTPTYLSNVFVLNKESDCDERQLVLDKDISYCISRMEWTIKKAHAPV
jgi:hypothetical protein